MTITRMPNGTYVDIAPGTPPEVVARIRAQHTPRAQAPRTAASAPRPAAPERITAQEQRTRDYLRQLRGNGRTDDGNIVQRGVRAAGNALQSATHEASFHVDDVVSSGLTAATAPDVWRGRRGIGEEYSAAREAMRRHRDAMREETPVSTTAGGLFGMVAGAPGKIAASVGSRVAPRATENIAARLATRPIRSAALEGAGAAGLTTLADTNGDVGRAAQSAIAGGAVGGVVGGVVGHTLPGITRAFRDRAPAQAERVAYDKIASLLARGRDETGAVLTPGAAVAEIADATARGTPTQLGDLTPEMSGLRGELSRRTALPSAGDVAAQAEQRLATAADRFDDQLRSRVRSGTGEDALRATARIDAGRKAAAATDYAKGGAMDRPLAPTPQIMNALTRPTPDMGEALKAARRAFANDPSMGPFVVKVRQGGKMVEVPTTRAFDEIKKAFDDMIESGIQHLPDGRTIVSNASRAASKQIRALKDQVARSNPEYAELVGRQRDAFERLESLNAGRTFLDRMRKQPRELLEELTGAAARNPDEVRTGLIDALLSMRNTNTSPIKLLRSWERNPQQRAVLTHVMGGQKAFNEFSKFMRRELRAMQADALVMRKSNSPALNDFVEHGEASPIAGSVMGVLRGQAYGGPVGGIAAGAREIDRLRSGMGPEAQEQTLRLLASDGEGLEAGVQSARAVRAARKARAVERARIAGRLGGRGVAAVNGTGE